MTSILTYEQTVTVSALLLSLLTVINSSIVRRRARNTALRLAEQELTLQKLQEELLTREENDTRTLSFQNSLQQAEVTTGLQQTRISFTNDQNTAKAPERYAYVLSMFRSGIPTEEISTALGMSSHEIIQLIKLSAIAQKTEQAPI